MIKTHIVETTEKYDTEGKLIEKITREECEALFDQELRKHYE